VVHKAVQKMTASKTRRRNRTDTFSLGMKYTALRLGKTTRLQYVSTAFDMSLAEMLLREQICVQLPTHADNVALPAFARLRPCSSRSISPACRAHGSKPTAASLLLWAHAGTDRRTDAGQMHRPCSTQYADSAANKLTNV